MYKCMLKIQEVVVVSITDISIKCRALEHVIWSYMKLSVFMCVSSKIVVMCTCTCEFIAHACTCRKPSFIFECFVEVSKPKDGEGKSQSLSLSLSLSLLVYTFSHSHMYGHVPVHQYTS